jgi:hypothetical protein
VISVTISVDSDGELSSLDALLDDDIVISDTLAGNYEFILVFDLARSE